MENSSLENNAESIASDTEAAKGLKKQKSTKSTKVADQGETATLPGLKIMLPTGVSQRVLAALKELKGRKVDCKAEELLHEFLNQLTDEYLQAQIQHRTPEEYYLEAASQIPELRAKLIEQAKSALLSPRVGTA